MKMQDQKQGAKMGLGIKRYLYHLFIDGLSGMALGLFATLIFGTILSQIALLIGGKIGLVMNAIASTAKALTGVGIGVGVAAKFSSSILVTVSAGICGLVGAFASNIWNGTLILDAGISIPGPGEPLGAFVAAYVGIEIGRLISGKTKLDILLTPFCCVGAGCIVGLLAGPPISAFMSMLGDMINWGVEQQPILMGIVVSVLMGMILTLPISSAALGVILGLSGIAAGAAAVGCCTQMIGFAVMSYRENKLGGLLAQGLGTSMLQIPNIFKKPIIWLPPIIASAILGPISSKVLGMLCNATGSGMGTAGLVGPIMTYQTMVAAGFSSGVVLIEIAVMYFIAPAVICLAITEAMRKLGWIKYGDLSLGV